MKKNVILLLCFAFVFTSCENFFKGENVRQQLEDRIAYANAPSYKITIDYPGAWGTIKAPVGGQTEKKVTDVFPLTFNTFVDYDFVCWKIIDSVTQKELKNGEYLLIDSLDKEDTMCTFVKAPEQGMQLCICIELAERPMIISRYPMTSNVIRDVSILVDFDMEMNPNSIYYTQPEYKQLINDPKKTLLSVNLADGTTQYYGYTTGSGDNKQYYFKNISITDKKTGKSILNCFRAPVFENNNTSLVIKPDSTNPPESYTSVLVNLEKGFYSTLKDADNNKIKDVEIAGSTKWMYKVNNGRDTKPLILLNNKINSLTINGKSLSSVTQPSDATFTSAMSSMKFVKNLNLYLDLTVQEAASAEGGASGPDLTFTLTLEKLYDKDYKSVSNSSKDIVIDYNGQGSQATGASSDEEASYKGTINLATETGNFISNATATDGVYAMSFVFKDKAGNSLTYPSGGKKLCFAKDGTGISTPQLLTAEDCIIPISNGKYKIKWKTPTVKDCKNTSIIVKDYYNNSEVINDTSTNDYFDVDLSEKNGSLYTIILEHKDYAGNTGTANEFKLNKYAFIQGLQKAGSDYVICGHYPQSAMPQYESVQINRDVYNGWILGTDGYFYKTYQNNYGENVYYRIEPIRWHILDRVTTSEGNKILLAENILYTGVYYQYSNKIRTENGKTIYPNDYEYSDISVSLNDAFIDEAFTIEEWNKLKQTDRHYYVSRDGAYPPERVTVKDRVFLLEYDEIRYLDYFTLKKRYTDYALKDKFTDRFGSWWYLFPKTTEKTQSSGGHNTHVVDKANEDAIVDYNGYYDRDNKTELVNSTNGIVPAIAVAPGDIPTN